MGALRDLLDRAGSAPAAFPGGDVQLFDGHLEAAVRGFQQRRGLLADGVVGEATSRLLNAARWRLADRILLFTPGHLMRGDDVAALQERLVVLGVLSGPVDGAFGPATELALRDLQRGVGLPPDGVCGPSTLRALAALGRAVGGGDPWALREQAEVAVAGKSLAGRVVVLDPAHGSTDPGVSAFGLSEADIVFDVATRAEGRLAAAGVSAVLTRSASANPDVATRAALTHDVGADVLLSLHCEGQASADARGVATFYWGDELVGARSAVGHRLASLVQREIVARGDLLDCRTHACTFDILRLTRPPAVQVDLGYLTNREDARRLGDPAFRDVLAEALVVAIQRLYLGDEDDATTGTLNLRDVLANSGLT